MLVKAFKAGVDLLDGNGDGVIERKEAGKAVGAFKRKFTEAAGVLTSMGPMLAMFGGGAKGGKGGPPRRGKGGPAGADNLRPRPKVEL